MFLKTQKPSRLPLVIPNQIIHKQRLKHPHISSEIILLNNGTLSGHCFLCQAKWANKSPSRSRSRAIKYAWNVITHYGARPLCRGRHNMQIAAIRHLMFCSEEFEVQLCPDSSSWGILCLALSSPRQSTYHVPENTESFSITPCNSKPNNPQTTP
ncbi:hypothetical protein CDAR_106751 [Caerostris darwini]|uniref:Uncharacterized protein n=1 Tax=Caerostris darwini TaxID=1538125 RepID=A0AAV4R3S2_9ARAC|nr:hypothetical protein CDAR_106751 [Caerostris darwini]